MNTTIAIVLDENQRYLLASTAPERVISERPDDDAPVRVTYAGGWLRVDRQIRHLHALGLVVRNGRGWSRTPAGDALVEQQAGES